MIVGDGVGDGRSGEERVEASVGGEFFVVVEDVRDDLVFGELFGGGLAVGGEVGELFDFKTEDVAVADCVGDGILVEALLEDVLSGDEVSLLSVDADVVAIFGEDGSAGETEELGLGEEGANGLVVVAELGAVAFVEDEDDAFVLESL